eukprot:9136865-Pyramimonas_sp.AAC.1
MDVHIPLAQGVVQHATIAPDGTVVIPSRRIAVNLLCNALLASGHGADSQSEQSELRRQVAISVDWAADHVPTGILSVSTLRDAARHCGIMLAADRMAHIEERAYSMISDRLDCRRRPGGAHRAGGGGGGGGAIVPVDTARQLPRRRARARALPLVPVGRTAVNQRIVQ